MGFNLLFSASLLLRVFISSVIGLFGLFGSVSSINSFRV